jgi:signal transduction histidine kinase
MLPLRSAAFRFGLLLSLIFAIGCALLLATVEHQVGHYAAEATRGMLRTETAVLAGEYHELGRPALIDAMARHGHAGDEAQFRYILTGPDGKRLFGDLPGTASHPGWATITATERVAGVTAPVTMTALGTHLPDGLFLVVATDTFDIDTLRQQVEQFTIISGICITLFALIGGYVIGSLFLRRLDRVNRVVDRIIAGERAERLPAIGFGPEFDDLTHNLNRMLDRNAAAMDALRQVSTDIAHDVRTPLSRLHQHLETMQQTHSSNPAAIDAAVAQTDNLLGIVQALLRIGTLEGGVGRQRFAPVDLTEVADRVYQAYQPVAEDAGHRLVADHAAPILVDGDAELLAQLLTNLIENAIVHTPPGTTITSRLTMQAGHVVVEVCDTGPGIPSEERSKVFGRFYRLDSSRHTDGAGLGLALVAAIAHLHDAACDIHDDDGGDNGGMAVRVTFPNRSRQI